MDKSVTLYRKGLDWQGEYLQGLSITEGQSRKLTAARDKTRSHRVEQGVEISKWAKLIIPEESLNKDTSIQLGDIILPGSGPKKLSAPSQPRKEGWKYFVVQEVENRCSDSVLPHILLKCL